MTERQPMNVRCGECGHVWASAYLPMPVAQLVGIMEAARCPMCGTGADRQYLAIEASGKDGRDEAQRNDRS